MKTKAEIEIATAMSILRAMGNTLEQVERWWPASKRGSNGAREFELLKNQRATALQCLYDAAADGEAK